MSFIPYLTEKSVSGSSRTLLRLEGLSLAPNGVEVWTTLPDGSLPGMTAIMDVKVYGAIGDGTTDDTAAIVAAQAALPTTGGILYFPPGTYKITSGLTLSRSNTTWRGAGMFASTITTSSVTTFLAGSPDISNVAFEDLGFDAAGVGALAIVGYGVIRESIRISRCRFYRFTSSAVTLDGSSRIIIEDSLFHSAGDAVGQAIFLTNSIKDVAIRRNRFLYISSGIIVDTGSTTSQTENLVEGLVIEGNYFDLAWWLLTARFSGASGVTYSATVLTDAAASFSGISSGDTVRVMPVKSTGTGTFSFRPSLTDASATFVSSGVRKGDIVRAGTAFGVVLAVKSETVLWVEDWLSDTTRRSVTNPTTGTTYTVYGTYLGKINASTGTTITVDRWFDFDGTAVTPSAATRYEVLQHHPNYPFNCEYATRMIRVINNTFRRGWSDQISIFGYDAHVIGNLIEDGQDMGITIHSQNNVVSGNVIQHQGAGGIFTGASDSVFANNTFTNTPWVNPGVASSYLSHLILHTSSKNLVIGNRGTVGTAAFGRFGMVVYGVSGNSVSHHIVGNYFTGHTTADIVVRGATATGSRVYDNVGVLLVDQSATLADQRGPGGAPAAGSAGSGATVSGHDSAGSVTIGSTPGTPTITFKSAYSAAPTVLLTSSANNLVRATSVSGTGFTISGTVAQNDIISWHVVGQA